MHMPEDDVGVAPAHSRYRALLDVSAALVEQPTLSLAAVTLLRRRFWRRIGYGPWMNSPWGVVWTPRDFGEYKQFHPRRQFRVNRDRNILLPSLESDIP